MRLSKLFMPTLKEAPNDAIIASNKLMIRAGLARKISNGLYSYLPLGVRILNKISNIIREEMNAIGSNECIMPLLVSKTLLTPSGRWERFKKELFRLKDRNDIDMAMGPTHEEAFTLTAKNEIQSYKDLPLILYQIETKFRDEIRPRYGVIRSKEFIMKDAYSFNMTKESLDKSYNDMSKAYTKIFKRMGLNTVSVKADSGAMGGEGSEEFMVLSEVGEETIIFCSKCDYRANVEKAEVKAEEIAKQYTDKDLEEVYTPNIKTINDLEKFFNTTADNFIKTILYKTEENEVIAVIIRGDLEINETKLSNDLGGLEIELADEETVKEITGAKVGFASPIGLKKKIKIYADYSIKSISDAIVGGNKDDTHIKNVNVERDIKADIWGDFRAAKEGDKCPQCGEKLYQKKGLELGHIFKLGDKYTKAFNFKVLDENNKEVFPIMGCYGIGLNRTLASIIEQNYDEKGIIFPITVAPYEVAIIPVDKEEEYFFNKVDLLSYEEALYKIPNINNKGKEEALYEIFNINNKEKEDSFNKAVEIYDSLNLAGIETILDDRKLRLGIKLNDCDLIGIPMRIIIGKKSLEMGTVEFKLRNSLQIEEVKIKNIVKFIKNKKAQLLKEINNNLKEYIESFDNIVWLYRNIIDNKILENENLKNIDNETKKELFDYIFDKYLDSESELNSLSIDSRYYGFFRLKDIEIFLSIEKYCIDKIKNEIEKIKISNVRNIFMRLDMSLFSDDKSLLNEIPFDEYLYFISYRIKDINYGNGYYYAKSMSLIFIINLLLEKIKEKEDIDKILDVIKKFYEFGQYNILEYIIYSLTKEEIQSDLIYDNLIKYCIKLFNEEKLRKSHLNKRITKILEVIIDAIFEDIERLKFILDIYFPKDEKELEKIYKYIDYEERYKLDIPLYCLSKKKIDIKNTLKLHQYNLIINYLALYVEKDNKIIIKNILDENIDLSIYWDLVREKFLEYCSTKTFDLYFFNRYRNILQLLNPTKEEFKNFPKQTKNIFYWYIIKKGDNKELYPLIPEGVKKAMETDKRYKEKIEEEKRLFQKERIECIHKFFDKNKIIEDISNIIDVLGDKTTFYDLSSYNGEFYKDKYENKEKYLEETERIIINPFIIDYFLIISRFLCKDISMNKVKEYVDKYWDKHWGIQLYNYLKRHIDIKANFSEEEKNKIKNYFKNSNYSETIKNLHNCLAGTFDNSHLYFLFYNLEKIFRGIKFEYDEEILFNMSKIPRYYYKGDIKLYNNNYYLEYTGIITDNDLKNIDFDSLLKNNKEMGNSIFQKLMETIDKDKITKEL